MAPGELQSLVEELRRQLTRQNPEAEEILDRLRQGVTDDASRAVLERVASRLGQFDFKGALFELGSLQVP